MMPGPTPIAGVTVLNSYASVPAGLIIDASRCVVNLAHYRIPHFQEIAVLASDVTRTASKGSTVLFRTRRALAGWTATHTGVIDTKTGRRFEERSAKYMEIWDWSVGKSADELTNYPAYALRIRRTGAASRPALHMLQAPRCAVPVIACTGDLKDGRIIRRGEPAVMACHWPGIYFNGTEAGFRNFQEVVLRLHAGFDNPVWKKNGESARYWAAKELT